MSSYNPGGRQPVCPSLTSTQKLASPTQERILQKTTFKLHPQCLCFLVQKQTSFRPELEHRLSGVSSLPAHAVDLGFASLHRPVSHFFTINLFLCLSTHGIIPVSLENPDSDCSLTQSPNPVCIQRFPSLFP